MTNNRSLARSKNTSTTVGDILIKEGLSLVIPGGGVIYETTKALINHGRSYFTDRTEARLEDFHRALLSEINDAQDFESFTKYEFDLDDYYALLSSCIQDVENEKVLYYSSLMRSLITSEISPETRRHFIMSLKDLSHLQIKLLKIIYIHSRFDLMTPGGTSEQINKIFRETTPLHRLALSKLESHYFIDSVARKLTTLGENFVTFIFSKEDLTPEGIGQKQFSGIKCAIICSNLGDDFTYRIADSIQKILWQKQIKSTTIGATDRLENFLLFNRVGIFICDGRIITGQTLSALEKFSSKAPLFRVNLNESCGDTPLGNIEFPDVINLKSPHLSESVKMLEEYILRELIE